MANLRPIATLLALILGPTFACSSGSETSSTQTPDDGLSTLTASDGGGVVADGTATATATVTLRVAGGAPLGGARVRVESSDSRDVITPAVGTTANDGVLTVSIASPKSGAKTLSAVVDPDGAAPVTLSSRATVTFVAGSPSALRSSITADPMSALANGTETITITVTVRDQNDNPVAGQDVQLAATGSSNTITQPTVPTDASGAAAGTLATTVAEGKTISAIIDPGGAAIAVQDTVGTLFFGAPKIAGPLRYRDVNRNGICDSGDTVTIPFDQLLVASGLSSGDLTVPVAGDSVGSGATVIGPILLGTEITVTLGSGASLRVRGTFDSGQLGAGNPSGIGFGALPSGAIVGILSGLDADTSGGPVDVIAEFVSAGAGLGAAAARCVATGDIDGDGDEDFVVGNTAAPDVVYRNNGSGKLTAAQSLGSSDTVAVELADVDRDGDLDLIVANFAQPGRVWTNDGAGTFTDSGQTLGNANVRALAVGDVDRDGDLDVVLGVDGAADQLWRNAGSGTFTDSGQSLDTGSTRAVALADVDGDGDLDLAVANGAGVANRIWSNDGNGTFTDSGRTLGDADGLDVAFGDLDHDGDVDAFVATREAPDQVFRNDGTGTFTDMGMTLASSLANDVRLVDYDGDGDLDAITAETVSLPTFVATRIRANDGSGTFSDTNQMFNVLADTRSTGTADLDRDGDLDLIAANSSGPDTVWLGSLSGVQGTASLTAGTVTAQTTYDDLDAADVDRDGDVDVFVADATNASVLYLGDGAGGLSPSAQVFASLRAAAFCDVDRDGDVDLVAAAASGAARVLLNNGSGTFTDSGQALGSAPSRVEVADIDRDGDADALFVDGTSVKVFTNNGSGVFADSGQTLGSAAFVGLALGDLDADGDLDFAAAVSGGANRVFTNNGSGVFADNGQALGSAATIALVAGDFDRDGDLDLFEAIGNGANRVWLNAGSATFTDSGQALGAAASAGAGAADFDGDGDLDLFDGVSGSSATLVYRNDGSGAFSATTQTIANGGPLIAVDLDHDGDVDLVIGRTSGVQVYTNP